MLLVNQLTGFGASELNYYMNSWRFRANAASGTIDNTSSIIARNLLSQLQRKSYFTKIKYIYPFLGRNLAAARTPLIYAGLGGTTVAANINFVEADYSLSTGIQGNGSTKLLNTGVLPSQLGTSNNGGFGWIETNINFTGSTTETMGCDNSDGSQRFVIDLRSTEEFGGWGLGANFARISIPATNGRYYFQRSSATLRELFKNGSSVVTNLTSDAASGANNRIIYLFGNNRLPSAQCWKGRGACAYFTDGTLSSADVADLDQTLVDYLMIPTGR